MLIKTIDVPDNKTVLCSCSHTRCQWKERHGTVTAIPKDAEDTEANKLFVNGAEKKFSFQCTHCGEISIVLGKAKRISNRIVISWRPEIPKPKKDKNHDNHDWDKTYFRVNSR